MKTVKGRTCPPAPKALKDYTKDELVRLAKELTGRQPARALCATGKTKTRATKEQLIQYIVSALAEKVQDAALPQGCDARKRDGVKRGLASLGKGLQETLTEVVLTETGEECIQFPSVSCPGQKHLTDTGGLHCSCNGFKFRGACYHCAVARAIAKILRQHNLYAPVARKSVAVSGKERKAFVQVECIRAKEELPYHLAIAASSACFLYC